MANKYKSMVLVLLACSASVALADDLLTGIVNLHTDKMLQYDEIETDKLFMKKKIIERNYHGDGKTVISAVKLLDQDMTGAGATPAIIKGGPGSTFVTVLFQGKTGEKIHFKVELWGPQHVN